MSEPTLTDEQRETLMRWWEEEWTTAEAGMPVLHSIVAAMLSDERAAREAAEAEARQHRAALTALRLRESDEALAECEQDLAAAIDRAEAAEAKVRDLTAGIGALCAAKINEARDRAGRYAKGDVRCIYCDLRWDERDQYGCRLPGQSHTYNEAELSDAVARAAAEVDENCVSVDVADLRALVDDPAAALAEVRAEAWDEGYETGRDDESFAERALSTDPDADEYPHRNPYRAEAEGSGR